HATYYGIAMVVKRLCQAIVLDEKSIFPVSIQMSGEYGLENVVLSMPAIVGENGVECSIPISLDENEVSKLHESADILRKTVESIEF
ncbi:MAG: L-lactate dehydrogenase, partial [Eubacterium sp.]|nr:L-lactate dehydrogenase [Eubacterium sp.]